MTDPMVGKTFEFNCDGTTWGVVFENATRMRHRLGGNSPSQKAQDISSAYLATPVDEHRIFVYGLEEQQLALRYVLDFNDMTFVGHGAFDGLSSTASGEFRPS
ncbi:MULTISPECIES: hypothetical protein [unclassified Halomonas]|uniref:Uncharacterized protein n=2 Tax=unclassified Halomonas TaxID=2609666 RepID=A0AAU7KFG5_9GAMM|nr:MULTISPECIES: hypothetical protein [unclassified Halomonas]MBR9773428.1 hypothetical protein [Gammaproteobacteria bacterium]KJZ02939.1 hypothetical protein TW86_22970 [Halomonas sp. S2151]MBR9882106.1 hypothetical protein [Gammaproteobacteria bacterium]MBY5941157.1 hypothetical protein [Halomonas sp. DP5N14-9]MBY6111664.1 hypothetical protein [Halomonas sp. DP1Y21-3]